MVSYGTEQAAIKAEARKLISDLMAEQEASKPAAEPVPDGYYGWDSTPDNAVAEAVTGLGIHRTKYRPEN
jgi:hypothetical protein